MKLRLGLGTIIVGAFTLVGVLVFPEPAYAGCTDDPPLPDGRLRKVGGEFVGQNFFNCSVLGGLNSVLVTRAAGEKGKFEMRWRNLLASDQDIRVREVSAATDEGFGLRYVLNGRDITAKLKVPSGKTFRDVEPDRSTPAIVAKIKVKPSATPGDVFDPFVSGQYATDASPSHVDTVSPRVEAAG